MGYRLGTASLLLWTACAHAPALPPPPPPDVAPVAVAATLVGDVEMLRERSFAPDSGPAAALAVAVGEATYYADRFDGRRTASGIVFRNAESFAAHRTYPFGTLLRVTNTRNQRSALVRVVDRGPHGTSARAQRTIIDLSRSVADSLGFVRAGRTEVRVEVLEWGGGR